MYCIQIRLGCCYVSDLNDVHVVKQKITNQFRWVTRTFTEVGNHAETWYIHCSNTLPESRMKLINRLTMCTPTSNKFEWLLDTMSRVKCLTGKVFSLWCCKSTRPRITNDPSFGLWHVDSKAMPAGLLKHGKYWLWQCTVAMLGAILKKHIWYYLHIECSCWNCNRWCQMSS